MKKTIALLMALTMALGLVSCGDTKERDEYDDEGSAIISFENMFDDNNSDFEPDTSEIAESSSSETMTATSVTTTVQTEETIEEIPLEEIVEPQFMTDPKEFIEAIKKEKMNKTISGERMWEVYISDRSKSLGFLDEKEYISNFDMGLFSNNSEIVDYLINEPEDMGNGIFKVVSMNKYDNGNTSTLTDYIIIENGKCGFLMDAIIDIKKYSDSASEGITLRNITKTLYVNETKITYDLYNRYDCSIVHGTSGMADGKTIIEGDNDTIEVVMNQFGHTASGATGSETVTTTVDIGEIKSITLTNVQIGYMTFNPEWIDFRFEIN